MQASHWGSAGLGGGGGVTCTGWQPACPRRPPAASPPPPCPPTLLQVLAANPTLWLAPPCADTPAEKAAKQARRERLAQARSMRGVADAGGVMGPSSALASIQQLQTHLQLLGLGGGSPLGGTPPAPVAGGAAAAAPAVSLAAALNGQYHHVDMPTPPVTVAGEPGALLGTPPNRLAPPNGLNGFVSGSAAPTVPSVAQLATPNLAGSSVMIKGKAGGGGGAAAAGRPASSAVTVLPLCWSPLTTTAPLARHSQQHPWLPPVNR